MHRTQETLEVRTAASQEDSPGSADPLLSVSLYAAALPKHRTGHSADMKLFLQLPRE